MRDVKVRWSLLGAGRIASRVVGNGQRVHNAEVPAVASRDLDRAQASAVGHALPETYDGYSPLTSPVTAGVLAHLSPINIRHDPYARFRVAHATSVIMRTLLGAYLADVRFTKRVAKQMTLAKGAQA